MSPANSRAATGLALMLLGAALTGCNREPPVAPPMERALATRSIAAASPVPQGAFFPLTIGNRWHSVAEAEIRIEPTGGGPPTQDETIHSDITRVLVGTEVLFGRSYVVEEETIAETGAPGEPNPVSLLDRIRYRQDATGLYEADVSVSAPSARSAATATAARPMPSGLLSRVPPSERAAYEAAWSRLQDRVAAVRSLTRASLGPRLGGARPGGLLENEITRLHYPLRPGATWVIRPNPLFTSTVEGVESLDLPAGRFQGYRVRIESEFFQAGDEVRIWFGRSGLLAMRLHVAAVATDVDGNVIGTMVEDSDEALHDLTLLRP